MRQPARRAACQRGFTLLEVMIAFAIMVVIIAAAFTTQGSSLAASARNRNVIVATSLARNLINEQEVKYEGLPLERLPDGDVSASFPAPHDKFKYTVSYKKVDFSALTDLIARAAKAQNPNEQSDSQSEMVMRVFKDHLEKSVRRMTVTIEWPEGNGTTTQTFTQLLVNHETELTVGL